MKLRQQADASRRVWLLAALLSVAAALLVVYLLPDYLLLSAPGTDMIGQFAAWRAFAAENIRAGHLPLWNPYTYAGQPFLGDFQSAMLYPLNAIFLFMPLTRALNFSFLLHLLIFGWGMGFWAKGRGYHPAAAALCGFVVALSGPVFPHLLAGHLSNICTLAWAPWIFFALETAWRGPLLRPLLFAAAAVCLQILAGHAQYVFYTAIAAGLHALVYSVANPAARRRALPAVAIIFLAGAALAAAQLFPGFAAASESVRQGRLGYNFVRMFSFPPENLATLFAPGFFGDLTGSGYWGRAYLWETTVFAGVAGLALGALALGDREHRRLARADLIVAALLFILALGDYTPLLRVLYDYFPGFGLFRSLAKFTFPMMLFGVLIMGAGADAVIRGRLPGRKFAASIMAAGVILGAVGIFFLAAPAQITGLLGLIQHTHESYFPAASYADPQFIHTAGIESGRALALAGGLALLLGAGFFLTPRWPRLRWLPLILWPLEMLSFARGNLATAYLDNAMPDQLRAFVAAHPTAHPGDYPGDYRVLNPLTIANNGFFLGVPDLWGNDPTVLKRYAEFITFTQGGSLDHVTQYTNFRYLPPIYAILRFRYAFMLTDKGYQAADTGGGLPWALLVQDEEVLPGRDAIFAALTKPGFDPGKKVFLESEPTPRPQPAAQPGAVHVTAVTTDSLTLEADTPAPALLLITDLYSRDWRARPLDGSVQSRYDIMPADYILRAIPLEAGHHHLIVEYAPPSFRLGVTVSVFAWLIWLGLGIMSIFRVRRHVSAKSTI